jgi:dCMP deaminase
MIAVNMTSEEKENLKEQKYNDLYMDLATRIAEMSYAQRLHVGAVIVKDSNIISFGWNGMPAGWDNICEEKVYNDDQGCYELKTKPEVLHAEENALAKLAKSTESGLGATLFITHAPCLNCAKLICQSGINFVYYRNSYRNEEGIQFLQKSGVETIKYLK